jgi:hypothetical protein
MEVTMIGLDQSPKSAVTTWQPRKRAGLQTTLAFATAAAAFFAIAGAAQAQDCVNGYRMVKGEIPVACSVGSFAGSALNTRSMTAHALYRGPAITEEQPQDSSDPSQCVRGYRTLTTTANGWTLPIPCHD